MILMSRHEFMFDDVVTRGGPEHVTFNNVFGEALIVAPSHEL